MSKGDSLCGERSMLRQKKFKLTFSTCNYSVHGIPNHWISPILRVVQTQAILFLESVSARVGSDIERLWIRMTLSRSRNLSFNFRVVISRIRLFPTLISNMKWLGSGIKSYLSSFSLSDGCDIHHSNIYAFFLLALHSPEFLQLKIWCVRPLLSKIFNENLKS